MSKGETTKSSVLRAALSLATEVGLEGVTIGKLADHVGMSKSGLFAHFASKENLQVAILEEAHERFMNLVITPAMKRARGVDRVNALIDGWIAWSKADFMPGGCIFVTATVELDDRPGPAREVLVAAQREWLATIAAAVRLAVEDGAFRADVDPELLAHEIFSIAYGYHFLRRVEDAAGAEALARKGFARILSDARAK